MLELLLIHFVSPAITGLIAFVFAKRKYTAEAKAGEIENVVNVIKIYKGISEDLNLSITELKSIVLQQSKTLQQFEMNCKNIPKCGASTNPIS